MGKRELGQQLVSLTDRSNLKTKKLIPALEVKPGEKKNLIYQNEDSEKCLICLLKEEISDKEKDDKYPVR